MAKFIASGWDKTRGESSERPETTGTRRAGVRGGGWDRKRERRGDVGVGKGMD